MGFEMILCDLLTVWFWYWDFTDGGGVPMILDDLLTIDWSLSRVWLSELLHQTVLDDVKILSIIAV